MKYVVLRRAYGEGLIQEVPIIFPNYLVHADVARLAQSIDTLRGAEVIAAGEIHFTMVICSGESTTLNVASREDTDATLVNFHDYMHGIIPVERKKEVNMPAVERRRRK